MKKLGGGLTEPPPWTSRGQTLACLGAWLTESPGSESWRAKESRKAGQSSRKTALAEQRALAGSQEKRESLCPLEEGTGHSGGLQGYHEFTEGES